MKPCSVSGATLTEEISYLLLILVRLELENKQAVLRNGKSKDGERLEYICKTCMPFFHLSSQPSPPEHPQPDPTTTASLDPALSCPTAAGPQQKMARACNSIRTWQGLLVPPGKRLMCSQTFLGFPCHSGQQRLRSAPRNSWQGQSPDPKLRDAPVSKSSWGWSVSEPGTGLSVCTCEGETREKKKKKKSSLQHHSLGTLAGGM